MKQFRITIYIGEREVINSWVDYKIGLFKKTCEAFADMNCCFTVEFQTI